MVARVLMCKRLEIKRITPMSLQNSIFISEVFQIDVSDGLVHSLGSRQIVNLRQTRMFMGHKFVCFVRV